MLMSKYQKVNMEFIQNVQREGFEPSWGLFSPPSIVFTSLLSDIG